MKSVYLLLLSSLLLVNYLGAQVIERGKATYYADYFEGRKTANGDIYRHSGFTAAHRTIPLGTRVKVTCTGGSNESCVVTVNDRCADHAGGIIDLSKGAASHLGFLRAGKTSVVIELLDENLSPEEKAKAKYSVIVEESEAVENLYPLLSTLSEKGYENITLNFVSEKEKGVYQLIIGPYKYKQNAELVTHAFRNEGKSSRMLERKDTDN